MDEELELWASQLEEEEDDKIEDDGDFSFLEDEAIDEIGSLLDSNSDSFSEDEAFNELSNSMDNEINETQIETPVAMEEEDGDESISPVDVLASVKQFSPQEKSMYTSAVNVGKSAVDFIDLKAGARLKNSTDPKQIEADEKSGFLQNLNDIFGTGNPLFSMAGKLKDLISGDGVEINPFLSGKLGNFQAELVKKYAPTATKVLDYITPEGWQEDVNKASSGKELPDSITDVSGLAESANTWTTRLASQAPQILASLNPYAGVTVASIQSAGEFINQGRELGLDDEQINKYVDEFAVASGAIEYASTVVTLGLNKLGVAEGAIAGLQKNVSKKILSNVSKKFIAKHGIKNVKKAIDVATNVTFRTGSAFGSGTEERAQSATRRSILKPIAKDAGKTDDEITKVLGAGKDFFDDDFKQGLVLDLMTQGFGGALTSSKGAQRKELYSELVNESGDTGKTKLTAFINENGLGFDDDVNITEAELFDDNGKLSDIAVEGIDGMIQQSKLEQAEVVAQDIESQKNNEEAVEVERKAIEQAEAQVVMDKRVDEKIKQSMFDQEIKKTQSRIKSLEERASKATDEGTHRALITETLQMQDELDAFKKQNETLQESDEAIEQDNELDNELFAEFEKDLNVKEGELEFGKEYNQPQIDMIRSIMEDNGWSEEKASKYYSEHNFDKKFSEKHNALETKVEAEEVTNEQETDVKEKEVVKEEEAGPELFHYNKGELTETDPAYFGEGIATQEKDRSTDAKKYDVHVDKTWFGTKQYEPETGVGDVQHKIKETPKASEVYNMSKDVDGLKNGIREELAEKIAKERGLSVEEVLAGKDYYVSRELVQSLYEKRIKEAGYKFAFNESEPTIMMAFNKVAVEKIAKRADASQIVNKSAEAHSRNNGGTVTASGEDLAGTANIAVSTRPDLTQKVKGNPRGQNLKNELHKFFRKNKELLRSDESLAIGTWYDEKTDTTYIDVTTIVPKAEKDKAIKIGRDNNQKAVFDLETGEEINTGGDGEVVEVTEVSGQEVYNAEFKTGKPIVVNGFHGSNKIDNTVNTIKMSEEGLVGGGVYIAPTQNEASHFGKNQIPVRVELNNPIVVDLKEGFDFDVLSKEAQEEAQYGDVREALLIDGYDGVIVKQRDGRIQFNSLNENQVKVTTKKEDAKKEAKKKREDLDGGTIPVANLPKLAEAIQEIKTTEKQRRADLKEKRTTKAKERGKGFKEVAEGKKPDRLVTTIKKSMSWLESKSKEIARGTRTDIKTVQDGFAKITRDMLKGKYSKLRGKMITKINAIGTAVGEDTRKKRYDEAIEYMNDIMAKQDHGNALESLKQTITKLNQGQKTTESKTGRTGFGTKETGKVSEQVKTKRGEAKLLESVLNKTKDKKSIAKLTRKINSLNKVADQLELAEQIMSIKEGSNEAIRKRLSNIINISTQRMNKIQKAQEDFSKGLIKAIPQIYQDDINNLANGKVNINSLTTKEAIRMNQELEALGQAKTSIADYSQTETQVQFDARKSIALNEIVKNNKLGKVPTGAKKTIKTGFWKKALAFVRRPNLMIQELAGGKDTVLYQTLVGAKDQSIVNELELAEQITSEKVSIFKDIKEFALDGGDFFDAIHAPAVEINGEQHSINEVMELYALSKSEDGQRVSKNTGYDLTTEELAKKLPKEYKKAVDDYMNFLEETIYPIINKEYKRQTGVDLKKTDNYWMIMNLERVKANEVISIEELGGDYSIPNISDGFTQERVPNKLKLDKLDFFGKSAVYERRAIRYAGSTKVLGEMRRMGLDPDVQNTINGVNKHYGKAVENWINGLVNGSQYTDGSSNIVIDSLAQLKNQFAKAKLIGRISTVISQAGSLPLSTPQLTLKGTKDTAYALAHPIEINDFVNSKDVKMRNRSDNTMGRITDQLSQSRGDNKVIKSKAVRLGKKAVKAYNDTLNQVFSKTIGVADKTIANSIWYGKYKDSIRDGKSEEESVKIARTFVDETQPTFELGNLSEMDRSRSLALVKMFSAPLAQQLNMAIDVTQGKKMGLGKGQRANRGRGVLQATAFITLSKLALKWASKYYDDDDDGEEPQKIGEYFKENFGKEFTKNLSANMRPVPVANAIAEKLTPIAYNSMFDKKTTWYENKNLTEDLLSTPATNLPQDVLLTIGKYLIDDTKGAKRNLKEAIKDILPVDGPVSTYKSGMGFIKFISDQLPDGDPRKQKLEDLDF